MAYNVLFALFFSLLVNLQKSLFAARVVSLLKFQEIWKLVRLVSNLSLPLTI